MRHPDTGPNNTHLSFIVPSSSHTKQVYTQVCNNIIRTDRSEMRNINRDVYDRGITREMSRQISSGRDPNKVLKDGIHAEKVEVEKENNNILNRYKTAGVDLAVSQNIIEDVKAPQTDNQLLAQLAQKYSLPLEKTGNTLAIANKETNTSSHLAIKN